MRKNVLVLLLAVLMTTGVTNVFAQAATASTSGDVTLNIKLHLIQSLVVNTSQSTVNLEYKTKDDYLNGVVLEQPNHLDVFSTGAFNISAKASTDALNGNSKNEKKINVADVKLTAKQGVGNTLSGVTMEQVALANTEASLVSSTSGGRDLKFNIEYKTEHEADAYINHYRSNENPTVYTTTVTYTIMPS